MTWEVHPDGPRWSLRRTSTGRLAAGGWWGVQGFGYGLILGFLLFGIDQVGALLATDVDAPPAFMLTVLVFAGFVAFVGFVARMLRFRHWIIDREDRTLGHSVRRVFADPQVESVSFDELKSVRLERAPVGQRTRVVASFRDGAEELLAFTRLGSKSFEPVLVGLRRAFDDTGVPVDVVGQE